MSFGTGFMLFICLVIFGEMIVAGAPSMLSFNDGEKMKEEKKPMERPRK